MKKNTEIKRISILLLSGLNGGLFGFLVRDSIAYGLLGAMIGILIGGIFGILIEGIYGIEMLKEQ